MRFCLRLAVAALLLVAGCGGQSLLDFIVLHPTDKPDDTPADKGYQNYQTYTVPVAAGRYVEIWHVPSAESKALVVVIPGCTSNKSWYLRALPVLVDNGYDAILIDYEGFGHSPGTPTLQRTMDDVFAVVEFAQTLHPKVVAFGASLGTPLAARVAAEYDLTAVVLEGSLILSDEFGLWLGQWNMALPPIVAVGDMVTNTQLPEGYDILKYVALVDEPKLIMHSDEDTVVPFASGRTVYEAAAPPKTFYELKFDHGKMISMNQEVYTRALVGWLDSAVGQR